MKIRSLSLKLLYIALAVIFVFGAVFTGCRAITSSGEEGAVPANEIMVQEARTDKGMGEAEDYAMEAMTEEAASEPEAQYSDTNVLEDRKVIKTAYISIEVKEGKFESTLFELTALAEQNGGFVADTQSYSDSEGNLTSGNITIRIPYDKFNSATDRIKEMGTVESISISGQDVTQEYTDLESRLKNYEAQEEILLDLMAQSRNVSDSIEVQRELSNVQEQVEIIKGRMNYLDNMVSFSTISVYLYEPEPITDPGWGFVEALKRGLRGAVTVFNFIVVFLIAVFPVLVLVAIILIIIWQVIRARKRRRAKKEK